ncbi:MAG: hypothetical protein BroJett025_07080 [Patescibacteria group bacterium]|nr:MAG: hypothetical protein BroJett025_07080 [Patescibacteria group bacterium]
MLRKTLRQEKRENLPPITEAVDFVRANSDVADLSSLKKSFLNKLQRELAIVGIKLTAPELSYYILKSRRKNLGPLKAFIDRTFATKRSQYDLVNQFNFQLAYAEKRGLFFSTFREKAPQGIDTFFSVPEDVLDFQLEVILNEPKLRAVWLREIDTAVQDSSRRNITEIDRSRRKKIKKDIVIIGGGPLTSLAVQLLGPFYNVTVITKETTIGKPWRNRPLYINSTVNESANGKRLPLQNSGTTPITVSGQLGAVRLSNLIDAGDLRVVCDDGVTREYIAGQKLGAAIATNIALGATDYIVGQEVDLSQTKVNADGTKELTLVDSRGKRRKIDAAAVICLTGPGREVCKIEDRTTRASYERAAKSIDKQIETNRAYVRSGRLNKVVWDLPKILTLTSIEKLYGFWYEELQANPDPKYFPLNEVFQIDPQTGQPKSVAIIGGADTAYTLSELFNFDGPLLSYPFELSRKVIPKVTHYNIPEQTPQEFAEAVRPRYKRVFSEKNKGVITTIANRVTRWAEVKDADRKTTAIVVSDAPAGKKRSVRTQQYDYVIPATGLERFNIENMLSRLSGLNIGIVQDREGQTAIKGDSQNGFYVGGSASGLRLQDYPQQVRAIIEKLRISENTISLWVNGLLVERFLWSFLSEKPVDLTRIKTISAGK